MFSEAIVQAGSRYSHENLPPPTHAVGKTAYPFPGLPSPVMLGLNSISFLQVQFSVKSLSG